MGFSTGVQIQTTRQYAMLYKQKANLEVRDDDDDNDDDDDDDEDEDGRRNSAD
jgi:hypothetical protein